MGLGEPVTEGLLFDPGAGPERPAATWFRGGSPTQRANVARGLHPLGLPLLEGAPATCGACKHFIRWTRSRSYSKCALRASRCRATDISRRWPACVAFVARPVGVDPRAFHAAD